MEQEVAGQAVLVWKRLERRSSEPTQQLPKDPPDLVTDEKLLVQRESTIRTCMALPASVSSQDGYK